MSVNLSDNLEPLKVWNIRTWYFISVGRTRNRSCHVLSSKMKVLRLLVRLMLA